MPIKVMIIGADSKIGNSLLRFFKFESDYDIVLLSKDPEYSILMDRCKSYSVDLHDFRAVKEIAYLEKPDFLVNAEEISDYDLSEQERKLCWDTNVIMVENLLSICRVLDSHLISFSSDMIFDGLNGPYSEEAKPEPLNYFGKSKHAIENSICSTIQDYTIVRCSLNYGNPFNNTNGFLDHLIKRISKGRNVPVSNKFFTNPVLIDDISLSVLRIIEKKRTGFYNLGGSDWINMAEMAEIIKDVFGYGKSKILKIEHSEFKSKTVLPEKLGLVTLKAETDLGINFSSFRSGLLSIKQNNGNDFSRKQRK